MSAHIERMQSEESELDNKVSKLSAFIDENPLFENLGSEDQDLMKRQLFHMVEYSSILGLRIQKAVTA